MHILRLLLSHLFILLKPTNWFINRILTAIGYLIFFCGYRQSEYPIPWVDAKVYVPVVDGDATGLIQQALNYVASLPMEPDGFRGAVQLAPGNYELKGKLLMRADGVVLRGSGCHKMEERFYVHWDR